MKKYPRITGWSIVIVFWLTIGIYFKSMQNSAIHEANNTAEDMIGWIVEDVANGRLDTATADTYIDNLEGIIIDLGCTR